MSTITLYAYCWVIGDTETIRYRTFPIEDDERRLGMIQIAEVEVEVPDIDPVILAAAKRCGYRQYQAAKRIEEQENAA